MRKTLLCVICILALFTIPAFASVQNIKISGDIDSTWLVRDQFDLGILDTTPADTQKYQNVLITQTRVRVDADLTEKVKAVVALINERGWGEENDPAANDTDVDLNLAYVELNEILESNASVVIGRSQFRYGNGLLIDSIGPNNIATGALGGIANDFTKRSVADNVRVILDIEPATIEFLAAKLDANTVTGLAPHKDDVDLYGVNTTYPLGDSMDTVVEGYFFSRIDASDNAGAAGGGFKTDSVYAPGFRVSTNPIEGLNVQGEFAMQFGNKATTSDGGVARADNVPRAAYAGQFITSYQVPLEAVSKWNPVVTGAYTFLSGDNDPNEVGRHADDQYTGWDPLLENQGGGTIYNTLFDLTNAHIVTAIGQINPMEDVTAKLTWTGMWLHRRVDDNTPTGTCSGIDCFNMRQPDTSAVLNPTVTNNKSVGNEVDFDLIYDYTEDVQLGVSAGWFIPGGFFAKSNNDVASQYITHANVRF